MLFSRMLIAASVACTVQAGLLRFRQSDPVPNCAVDCLNDAASRSGSQCSSSNVTCLCFDPMVSGYLLSCLGGSCPSAQASQGQQYFRDQCAAGQAFTATSSSGSSTSSSLASFLSSTVLTTDSGSSSASVTSSESVAASSITASVAPSSSPTQAVVTSTSIAGETPPTTLAQVTSTSVTRTTDAVTVVTVTSSASSPPLSSPRVSGAAVVGSTANHGVVGIAGVIGAILLAL